MSANALLKRFDIVADQPANIPALRRLVVDLAVRGKLLPDDELDMDVQEMLRRISSKADDLVMAGAIKKQKHLPNIGDDEVPAAYLAHCTFARLGNIANLHKGLTGIQSSTPGEFPLVVTSAERGTCDHFDFDGAAAIIPLVSSTGHGNASINRLHYQAGKFALGTILCAVFPFDESLISARFLYEYLTAFKEDLLVSKMIGTANVTLTLGKIAEVPVPILAPAVQRRVDELMTLCDQLEAAQQERERRRDRLAAASLQRLNQPAADTTPEAQREHARFHLHHLPRLTTRPEHIEALRQAIFNLAVHGRLVRQNTDDENAIALLKRIDQKRVKLLSADYPNPQEARTQLRKQEIQVLPDKLSFSPDGWSWATLMQCSLLVIDCHNKTAPYSPSGIPLIRTTNVRNGCLNLKEPKFVDDLTYARWSARCEPDPGDIVITREAPMGEVAVIPSGMKICLGQRMMLARLVPDTIDPQFLLYSLRDPNLMERVQDKPIGATVQHLRVGGIETLLVPLPPLAEQQRIVAKVDELMALCDQLEAQLRITQTDSRRLLEAVLEAALAPA